MALATQCPHCHTTFRVASDQLKLRGGIVRCGTCQRIFDGSAHLIDLEALAARKAAEAEAGLDSPTTESPAAAAPALPTPEPAASELTAPDPAASEPAAPADDGGDQPVYTLDFDHTFDPFGILPKVEPAASEPAAAAQAAAVETAAVETDAVETDALEADALEAEADDTGAEVDDLPPAPESGTDDEAPADARPEPEAIGIADDAAEATEASAPSVAPESPEVPEPEAAHEPEPEPEPEPAPAPAHAYAPAGRIEPGFDLPVDEELVAQPLPGHESEPEHTAEAADAVSAADAAPPSRPAPWARSLETDIPSAALPLRASVGADPHPAHGDMPPSRSARAKAVEARARRSKMTPTRIEPPKLRVPAEPDEPEFVKRSRRQEQSGRTVRILMAAGAVVLLLVLAAQLLLNFRNELAVRHPAARPLLSSLCALAGCRVGLPAQAENLVIDDGELSTLGPDTYSLTTQLRNQGSLALAWPSIELELTDANNKPVLRRVFGPADYLPSGTPVAAGFAAHTEQPVKLNFALAELKPSGYHTFVFYP